MKIKVKLLFAFILISLIPLILIAVISLYSSQIALKNSIKKNFQNLAGEKARAISHIIKARIDETELLASTPAIREAVLKANMAYANKSKKEIQGSIELNDKVWIGNKGQTGIAKQILNNDISNVLTEYQNLDRGKYGEIFVTDREGATVAMTKTLSDYYQADETWWVYGFNNGAGGLFIDDRGYDMSIGALAMGIVVPIRNDGKVIGILKINYKVKEIIDIVSKSSASKTSITALARSQGDILAISGEGKERKLTNLEKQILTKKESGYIEELHEGRKTIHSYSPVDAVIFTRIPFTGEKKGISGEKWDPTIWYLFIDIEQSEAFAAVKSLRNLLIIIAIIVLSLVAGLALLVSKSISGPISALHMGTEIIGSGRLDYKIGIHAKDEIGQLANSFNKMTDDLKRITVSKYYVDNIIKSMSDILIVVNPDATIRTVNQATLNLLEYKEDELIGMPVNLVFTELEKAPEGELPESSVINDLIKKGVINGVEKTYLSKTGRKTPVLFSGSAMRDDKGEVLGIVCVASDITERKRSEEQLRLHRDNLEELVKKRTFEIEQINKSLQESVELFHTLADNAPVGIWRSDKAGGCIYINKRCSEIINLPLKQAKGDGWTKFIHPDDKSRVCKAWSASVKDNKPFVSEYRFLFPDGKSRWVYVQAAPERGAEGNIIGYVGTQTDITERKIAEEKLLKSNERLLHAEKLSAVGKLSASIAHEFNNPIFGIRNVLETVSAKESWTASDKAVREMVEMGIRECDRMADLIIKLRDFYRPSSGIVIPVNIKEIIEEVLLICKIELKNRKIILKTHYNSLPQIKAVPDQIKQVILNLIQNAGDAAPDTGGKLTITTEYVAPNALIHFKDNGSGISETDMKSIFEPFFTTKPEVKGTGLGLSICHGIINKHGGEIKVESQLGEETTFTISLPA